MRELAEIPQAASPHAEHYQRLAAVDLGGGERPGKTAELIVDAAVELLHADAGAAVLLWDAPDSIGRVAACSLSCDGSHLPAAAAVQAVARNGEPWHATGAYAGQSGILAGSVVATPLRDEGINGVLVVARYDTAGFEQDAEFVGIFAERAAAALSTARRLAGTAANRERFEVLAWVANALIAVGDLDDVLGAVVEGVAAALVADRVLLTVEPRQGSRRVMVGGLADTDTDLDDTLGGQGLDTWVVRHGRVAALRGGMDDDREGVPGLRATIGCARGPAVAAPVAFGDTRLGMLAAFRVEGAPDFDDAEVDLVLAVAGQAGAAIDHVRLSSAREQSLMSTKALYSVTQLLNASESEEEMMQTGSDGALEVLPATHATFAAVDLVDRRTVSAAASGRGGPSFSTFQDIWRSPAGRVLRTGSAVRSDDDEFGSWMAAPLKVHGRILGLAVAGREAREDGFTGEDVELFSSLVSQVALSVDNLRHIVEVQHLADTDDLTGLFNRRSFDERASLAFRTSVRLGTAVSVMMFDVDHFKRVNDTHGHAVGDRVLRRVAAAAKSTLRDVDVLGRYGGEEFAAVLPAADGEAAAAVAERLRAAIAAVEVDTSRGTVTVKVSAGVAARVDEEGVQPVLERADAALYEAKRGGRDRVVTG